MNADKKRIVTVLGARPQFIKASVVSNAFALIEHVEEILIHTGQHFDSNMSDIFFTELGIRAPDFHLGIHGLPHGAMTGRMMESLEKVLQDIRPYAVLVYGDTDSTLAGALAAVKLHIPVAHVEAGLRSFNRAMPEEINRIVTDHVSSLLFTPTDTATENLIREGVDQEKIIASGDVMYDAALYYAGLADKNSRVMETLGLESKNYYLATIHRPQNTDDRTHLTLICHVLDTVAKDIPVVMPVHPRTRKMMETFGIHPVHITLTGPVGYLDMIRLEQHAALIITDSGGVQKEAYFHRVPCITLRPETEWTELVDHGWNTLLPPGADIDMVEAIHRRAQVKGDEAQLYGDGHAAVRICQAIAG